VNTALLSAEQAQQCLQLNPDFTLTELKKAYRRKALLLHPDRTSGDVEKFRQVQQAYQQLLKACQ
jgi:curved DNA-binding protein CbpA